jgi:hypothetical protein
MEVGNQERLQKRSLDVSYISPSRGIDASHSIRETHYAWGSQTLMTRAAAFESAYRINLCERRIEVGVCYLM